MFNSLSPGQLGMEGEGSGGEGMEVGGKGEEVGIGLPLSTPSVLN